MDITKNVSKYLFKRDQNKLDPSYLEDGEHIIQFIDECMALGLGISGAVNKLTSLLAGAKFHRPQSAAVHRVEEERRKRSGEKTAQYKRKRTVDSSESEKQCKRRKK